MPKTLKQIKRKVKAVYHEEQEYLGKQDYSGDDEVQLGGVNHFESENAGSSKEEVEQGEEREGRSPEGILGDLPPEIQEYVERNVSMSRAQRGLESGDNGEGEVQLDENGFVIEEAEPFPSAPAQAPQPTSIEETIADIFDAPLMTPELQEKLQSFKEAIEDMSQKQEEAKAEQEMKDAFEENAQAQIPEEDKETETPAQPEQSQTEAGEQKQPQGGSSCTESERAFLDAFMALQEAGSLLGMIPSTRYMPKILDLEVGGIRNVSILPTVASMNQEDENEAHTLLRTQADILFQNCEKMLQDKGI